jgi:hypothetical protein
VPLSAGITLELGVRSRSEYPRGRNPRGSVIHRKPTRAHAPLERFFVEPDLLEHNPLRLANGPLLEVVAFGRVVAGCRPPEPAGMPRCMEQLVEDDDVITVIPPFRPSLLCRDRRPRCPRRVSSSRWQPSPLPVGGTGVEGRGSSHRDHEACAALPGQRARDRPDRL